MTRRCVFLVAGVIGVLGAIATAIGFASEPAQAAFSYLTAWTFALTIALGALVFLMIGHAMNARWTVAFQRITDSITGSLPALAVLFVPIALAAGHLYSWIAPPATLPAEQLARLAHKAPYLNLPFWLVRAAAFLASWIAIAELVTRWSARAARDPASLVRARMLSAAGLPFIGLTLTFASFDWLMSLTPQWYSTIYGLLYWSGGFVAGLSLIAVIAGLARRVPVVAANIHAGQSGALGRLMFAFLVFWAYMEFAQGIIIWIANKPDEVPWYVARGAGAWGGVFAVLIICHFAIPFFALLSRPLKRRPVLLAIAGGWIVAMHYIDVYWLVMPVLHKAFALHWLDVAAPCGVLGLAIAAAAARTRTRTLVDEIHPGLAAAAAYEGT